MLPFSVEVLALASVVVLPLWAVMFIELILLSIAGSMYLEDAKEKGDRLRRLEEEARKRRSEENKAESYV
jgi:biopolymer transport protein ExbB/TolQ